MTNLPEQPLSTPDHPLIPPPHDPETLAKTIDTLSISAIQRHIFLCADQTKPKCCSKAEGLAAWKYLKRRLNELGLTHPSAAQPYCIFRTKANCLRICTEGPILLIYPDGVWYRKATPDVIEDIIQKHLLDNQIVKEYALIQHHLALPPVTDAI